MYFNNAVEFPNFHDIYMEQWLKHFFRGLVTLGDDPKAWENVVLKLVHTYYDTLNTYVFIANNQLLLLYTTECYMHGSGLKLRKGIQSAF